MSGHIRWCVAALIGGFIGASIWAGITYFTGYEIGWIAWGVGLLVGVAVRMGAGDTMGVGPGAVAVIGSVAALLAGKYAAVHFQVQHEMSIAPEMTFTAEDMQLGIASDIIGEWEEQGKKLNWPPGQSFETAEIPSQFPVDVWAEAQKRWNEIPPAEQTKQIDERKALISELTGSIQGMVVDEGFKASFSPIDLLFFGLAVFTAFKVGSGISSE
jgi:hypothetical protein